MFAALVGWASDGVYVVYCGCLMEACPSTDLVWQLAPFPQLCSVLLRPHPLDPLNPQRQHEHTSEGLSDVFLTVWLHFVALILHLNIETVQFLYTSA